MPEKEPERDKTARLGRALVFVHQQLPMVHDPLLRAELETLLAAGRALEFAAKLRGHGANLTPALALQYAKQAGVGPHELRTHVLPRLAQADVVTFSYSDDQLTRVEEYVGLTAPVLKQALRVLEAMAPSETEWAILHSVEIASWAPLTTQQHEQQLAGRGFPDEIASKGKSLALATGVNKKVRSPALNEDVIYNPNVWTANYLQVASFLKGLPPGERDALLGMVELASRRPALALPSYGDFNADVLTSARKVGLLHAATVKSSRTGAAPQTYVFSPMNESEDDAFTTTETLHQRKLFVAHMLYGHEKATLSGGRIIDPVVLASALLRRGSVGPASNIATDYHLLEGAGIISVETQPNGRAFLNLVKPEIIEGGIAWLRNSGGSSGRQADLNELNPPSAFTGPERDRANLPDVGEADEIANSAVLAIRVAWKEAQNVARFEF
jgi:hypothetical protein